MKKNKAIKCDGKTYEIIPGKIGVGDLYYFEFSDSVLTYKHGDYGNSEPNKLGCVKVKLI